MKNTIREKLYSFLILAGGVLVLMAVSGFSSGVSFVKDSEAWQKIPASTHAAENPLVTSFFDTIPEPAEKAKEKEKAEAKISAKEALEEIDWEEVKKEMEEAKLAAKEAMEEIDWEELKQEMEEARITAMEEINWEEIQEEIANSKIHFDSVMTDLDFDIDVDFDFDVDVDFDHLMEEVRVSLEGMNWEELEEEMARAKLHLDSILQEMDFDVDIDLDE